MKKPVTLWVSIYGVTIVGFLGWSQEEFRAWVSKKYEVHLDPPADGCCATVTSGRRVHLLLWMSRIDKSPATMALYAHECLHAALSILKQIGQGVDPHDHEHLTYLFQSIFQGLLEKHAEVRMKRAN